MKKRSAGLVISLFLLLLYMLSFTSCEDVTMCWTCVNPRDSRDWLTVCNAMAKVKWESYGYICN